MTDNRLRAVRLHRPIKLFCVTREQNLLENQRIFLNGDASGKTTHPFCYKGPSNRLFDGNMCERRTIRHCYYD